jgi:hypothetical protein
MYVLRFLILEKIPEEGSKKVVESLSTKIG